MNSTNFYNEIRILSLCCQGLLGARDIVLSPIFKTEGQLAPLARRHRRHLCSSRRGVSGTAQQVGLGLNDSSAALGVLRFAATEQR